MASGWNLWVWLECIHVGVVNGCCYKEVYRFPHITFPYSTCISSFFAAAASLLLCLFNIFGFCIKMNTLNSS